MDTKVKYNSVFNFIKTFSQFIFPLITFPYISRVLGPESVGKVNFSNSIIAYISMIATLGIASYAIRECAKVKGDKRQFENVASEIYSISILSTALAYGILFVILFFSKSLQPYSELIIILGMPIMLNTCGAEWINNACEEFKFITIRSIIFQILSLILMFIFVNESSDYYNYAWILLLSTSGSNIINIFYRRKYGKIKFTFNMNIKKHLKPVIYLFAIYISQQIYVNSDITILGLFKGDVAVGIYSIAVKIYNIVNAMICSVCMVVIPQVTYWFSKNEYSNISKLFNYALGFIITLGLPTVCGINMLCPEIIACLAGEEYRAATTPLCILTVALIFSLLGGLIGNVTIIPAGREKICFLQGVVAAIVNIVLNLLFIPSFGINAAACTTAMAEGISFFILLFNFDTRIKLAKLKKNLICSFVGVLVIATAILLIKSLVSNSFHIIIISVPICVTVYFIVQVLLKNDFVTEFVRKKVGEK